jgi:glycogen debranching enzyme
VTAPEQLAEAAAAFLDLRVVPFTLPGSRLLVRSTDAGLSVCRAEYEVSAEDAVAVTSLRLFDGDAELPVTAVHVDRIEFGDGAATLTFAGARELSLGSERPVRVAADLPDGGCIDELTGDRAIGLVVSDDRRVTVHRHLAHAEHLAAVRSLWLDWFARCPSVRPDLQAMAAHCWWVLGANQVELDSVPESRAVVPAKLGYVALWQWDAYFIAIGLRHGDLELAQEQLELAFRFQAADGQLPDVVHDDGVLASSDDLPAADLARLRELASPVADPDVPIALTKPPLAALALARLAESGASGEWLGAMVSCVQASQQWWFDHCLAADGLPEYGHPYSSGLDDSPVFDTELPVATPELAAYLELADLLLADLLTELGQPETAEAHRRRAGETHGRLLRLWHPETRRFAPRGSGGPIASHTVLDLLPLLVGCLPADVVADLLADLADPATFAAPHPVPTVALADEEFTAGRMWRGPVWLNTNWLLVEGLVRSGCPAAAEVLAQRTLAMVVAAGGAFEYYHPFTGRRAPHAAPAFGWTAALFLDLAVRYAPPDLDPAKSS